LRRNEARAPEEQGSGNKWSRQAADLDDLATLLDRFEAAGVSPF